ncbi:hypothetical protein Tco_0375582 [Tanacetum coccineum]
MSNSNTNWQTQSSNALHNAIMEAGSKDRPPMLAPGNYVQWKSRIKRYIDTNLTVNSSTTISKIHHTRINGLRKQFQLLNVVLKQLQRGIYNDIYSIVDACPNACEMWKAIERLKQGESINVQDLETNLYWEFEKFTSRDVNVQFLLQLQPEWQRFVTLVKQSQELKTVSYHKLYDILKQHQNEVNEIRAERLARTANPLALVAQQQPVYHHQNHPTQNTQYSSTRSQQSTRNRGKAIVTSSAPTYDPEPDTVTEDDEMSKDKEIDKLMALISLSGTGYDNQREVNVVGAMENVECQKPKQVKDAAYHKEKMLLCKQEEAGVQLNAEQADWKDDTDDESEDQELEAHYINDTYLAELGDTNITIDSLDICYDSVQDDQDDLDQERDLLASLIQKLKCEIDDSKN